jgi:hypothetical protein
MQLNPKATQAFNQKAEGLLQDLAPEPSSPKKVLSRRRFVPDIHVTAHISPEDIIGEIEVSRSDPAGNETGKVFKHGGQTIQVVGENYQKIAQIARGIQKSPDFRDTVSVKLLIDLIFAWLKERYRQTNSQPMTDYVLRECEKRVQDYEVWIPIAWTRIESELEFGNVKFKTITRGMIDRWEQDERKKHPEAKEGIDKYFEERRKDLLGLAAATINLRAEPIRAYEIALQESEDAIALLRSLSVFSCFPYLFSHSVPLGREHVLGHQYLFTQDGNVAFFANGFDKGDMKEWRIDNEYIALTRSWGLDTLSDLLKEKNKNQFQQEVFNAYQLYSKSSLHKELADKLTYILAPLEGILSVDRNQTYEDMAERLVLLVNKDLQGRKEALATVERIYERRLSFVRGEYKEDDVALLQKFMVIAWTFFINLIGYVKMYRTKDEFIRAVDNLKLSGGLK